MSELVKVFEPLRKSLMVKWDKVSIDNSVFRLHYKATFAVLVVSALIVGTKEYIGDPIQCMTEKELPEKLINLYCWIHPTFTLPNRLGVVGVEVAHPGVASPHAEEEVKYHKYYQWVFITLIFQAILFYAPHYIWKILEGGCLKKLIAGLQTSNKTENVNSFQSFLEKYSSGLNQYTLYAFRFFFCEFLNLVNVIGQMYLMDRFLDGEFFTYGLEALQCTDPDSEKCSNPMSRVFPKVSKCVFNKFGPSGVLEERDAICVLAINVVNEKVYIFLWFWFIILAAITGLMMVYRLCVLISLKMRVYLLYSQCRSCSFGDVVAATKKCCIGDWFVLYQLSRNVEPTVFNVLMSEFAAKPRGGTKVRFC